MDSDGLMKRINKVLAQIGDQLSQEKPTLQIINGHLLTDQELARLEAYVAQVEPKLSLNNGRPDLRALTDQELDEGRLWCALGTALDQEDLQAAARYRRWLNTPIEQLVQEFLAIDLSFLPEGVNQPGIPVQEGHATFHLTRTRHRMIAEGVKRRPESNIEEMRRWLGYITENNLAA